MCAYMLELVACILTPHRFRVLYVLTRLSLLLLSPSPRVLLRFPLFKRPLNYYVELGEDKVISGFRDFGSP